MLDIRFVRERPELVRADLEKRQDKEKQKWLDELLELDKEYRSALQESELLRKERNELTDEINRLMAQKKEFKPKIAQAKTLPAKIKDAESKAAPLKEKIDWYLMRLPNILHGSVPAGKDDSQNVVVREFGTPKKPSKDLPPHGELLEKGGWADFTRGTKVAGAGFYFLKGDFALLEMSLMRYAIDKLSSKGYSPIVPPFLMNRAAYEGVTDLGDFENVMYKIEGENLYLIATSEHPIASMLMNETLVMKDLPVMFAGISPCFRKEVGTHGKYTKGMFRVHNFYKIEQFIFCHPDESWKLHEKLQKNSEEIYKKLGLYYRVVNVCTGDMGDIAAKKYDIEAWMADNAFRETGSNSNCTDYQARRLGIKYREGEGKPPKDFVHTLNNTAIADRVMIALIEQFQKKDCTVTIPKVLWKYTGFKRLEKLA